MSAPSRGTWLLFGGAAIGIASAAVGLLSPRTTVTIAPSGTVVARVNGQAITRADYDRVLSGVTADRREPLDAARRQQVLDRLIEEELLVQRALALGLPRSDPKTRNDLVQAMLATIIAEAEAQQPTDAEVAAFYDANRGFFRRPGQARVRQIFCRARTAEEAAEAERRCVEAARRWRDGEPFSDLVRALGDPVAPPLPDSPLPTTKLTEYLGPTATNVVANAAPGTITDPIRVAAGFRVIEILERDPDADRPLDEVRDAVRAEMRRRGGDDAVRRYLTDLRRQAAIMLAPDSDGAAP